MRGCRVVVALVAFAIFATCTATAGAAVIPRLADFETSIAPYGIDQTTASCERSSVARDTTRAYTGVASLRVRVAYDADCSAIYARGIFNASSSRHLLPGDDVWIGVAIYVPPGFWASHREYTDLVRVDSYVDDSGQVTDPSLRQYVSLAAYSDDTLHVRAVTAGANHGLAGPLSPATLPEGRWTWVELHLRLSPFSGQALSELKVDGRLEGRSTLPNVFGGRAPYNRIRYGLVSDGGQGTDMTMWIDRASVSTSERGPADAPAPPPPDPGPEPSPPEEPATDYDDLVLDTAGLVSYWRLGETSGGAAVDAKASNRGYYDGPTLGVPGLIVGDPGTAVRFDGAGDRVIVPASGSLSPTAGVSLEAWARAGAAIQGTVLRRANSYELRMQDNGSVLFRVWVGGNVETLVSPRGAVEAGRTYHLVGTYDGSALRIYRNGVEIAERAQTGAMTHSANSLLPGFNDYSGRSFLGVIDDVAVYGRALPAAVVAGHHDAGAGID